LPYESRKSFSSLERFNSSSINIFLVLCSATRIHCILLVRFLNAVEGNCNHLFDDVGAELLDRQSTNIASKLTDHTITEPVVVEIKNVLHNLK
jgi:hypothetical protein